MRPGSQCTRCWWATPLQLDSKRRPQKQRDLHKLVVYTISGFNLERPSPEALFVCCHVSCCCGVVTCASVPEKNSFFRFRVLCKNEHEKKRKTFGEPPPPLGPSEKNFVFFECVIATLSRKRKNESFVARCTNTRAYVKKCQPACAWLCDAAQWHVACAWRLVQLRGAPPARPECDTPFRSGSVSPALHS